MTPVTDADIGRIHAAFGQTTSIRAAARMAGVSFDTAKKYAPPMTPGVPMKLDLGRIRMDPATQPRAAMDEGTIEEYSALMTEGKTFPALVVFFDGTDHWLGDGWHRATAAIRAGMTEFECDVKAGTKRDAILYSVGANAEHGLTRSNADKRRAVLTLMTDPEWSQLSNAEIARRCGVRHAMTNAVRKELAGAENGYAPRQPRPTAPDAHSAPGTNGAANGHVSKPSIPLMTPRPGDPPDVAEGRRNGTIPADVEVEVTEPEPSEPDAHSAPPAEMTDAEYLESLPARPHLAEHVRKRFDVEALTFRRVSALRRQFAAACKPMTNEAKKECNGHIGPWMGRHFFYLRSDDPTRWKACKECSGSGQVPLIGQCPACHSEGYHV